MEDDDLRRRDVARAVAVLHLALHLRHAFAADTIEGHDSCERHKALLVEIWRDCRRRGTAATFRQSSGTTVLRLRDRSEWLAGEPAVAVSGWLAPGEPGVRLLGISRLLLDARAVAERGSVDG